MNSVEAKRPPLLSVPCIQGSQPQEGVAEQVRVIPVVEAELGLVKVTLDMLLGDLVHTRRLSAS